MVIDFSKIDFKERPMLVLRNLDGAAIQTLGQAFNIKCELYYNEVSKITFDIPAFADGIETPHYDDIVGTRIVDVLGIGQFVLMNPKTVGDGIKEIKSCTAYSLEYELTYKKITIEEGTYNFFNPVTPDDTIVGIILSYLPSWSIGNVDDSLVGKYRTFSVSGEKIYDFIKSTVQKTYGCIFDFDTDKRQINIRAVINEAMKSPVYISYKNLAKEIEVEEDTENILTVLDVNGADGVDIRSVNPMGTNKIYNLDYYMNTTNFSQDIIDRWNNWKRTCNDHQLVYYNLTIQKMLKTSAILTEENRLLELTNEDLAVLENQRSVEIEYLASTSNASSEKLKDINKQIQDKNKEIEDCKADIEVLNKEKDELTSELVKINKETAFSNFFTEEELKILDRYFKEDTIEDSSFVISEAESYVGSDWANNISNKTFDISSGTVTEILGFENKRLFTVDAGKLKMINSYETVEIEADIIKASFEKQEDGSFVFSGYLGDGKINNTENNMEFVNGCISLTGTCANISTNAVADEEAPDSYKTGTELSFNVTTSRLYFTKNTTEYEKFSVEWDLYEYGCDCLKKLAYPSYSFDVSSANFLSLDEFYEFSQKLSLGKKIYLEMREDKVLNPILVGVSFDFDDLSSLKLNFGDTYNLSDSSFSLVDLLEQSVSMGKKFDTSRFNYNSFIDSGASTAVREFMNNALDVAKNAILSGSNMAISWDSSGIHCRKWKDKEHTGYESEEIAIINNSIVFTDNNWQTAKMAIGKVVDENIAKYTETTDSEFDENKVYYYCDENDKYQIWEGNEINWSNKPRLYEKNATAYGIVAPYIVGTLLAGENLVIESQKKDGDTSVFKVDAEGASLHNASFSLYDSTSNSGRIDIGARFGFVGGNKDNMFDYDESGNITGLKTTDDNSVTKISDLNGKTPNANFWMDMYGDTYVKGIIDATGGIFRGSLEVGGSTAFRVDADGNLKIGGTSEKPNFKVDSTGNLTAKSGVFYGVVQADDFISAETGESMLNRFYQFKGGHLDLKGLTVSNGDTITFNVTEDGNVSIKGKLNGCDGTFSGSLQVDTLTVTNNDGNVFLKISVAEMLNMSRVIFSDSDNKAYGARWDFKDTIINGNVSFMPSSEIDFGNATIKNLHATFA